MLRGRFRLRAQTSTPQWRMRVEAARQRCGYSVLAHKTHPPIIKQEPKQMPDLIDDGTWREAALARMSEVFPTNRGLWPMYRLMAGAHRYAIDYIEQAPVIVLAAAHGNAHVSWSERAFIQEQLRKMCESKAQLRDVMRVVWPTPAAAVTRRQGVNRNAGRRSSGGWR